jgi:hypothetical protein
LKSALVPDRKRREIALVFDSSVINKTSYGHEVFRELIPIFERLSNNSILVGDYLNTPGREEILYSAFRDGVVLARNVTYRHPTQFFIVYINNLSESMFRRFDETLQIYPAYVGFADMTISSPLKIFLSTMLVNLCIKHGRIVIQGHESDRAPGDDVNMSGYPFEEAGYTCRSISSDLMGVLLSYKIERPIYPGFEVDTEFSLNAVSNAPFPLTDFRIEVTNAKIAYIKSRKAGSVERAGLEAISTNELAALIAEKLSSSYIYNLSFNSTYDVVKFNIIIELPSRIHKKATRLLAALEYRPDVKTLRLITLY